MAKFNSFKQNSVSIPLYKTDGYFGDPLEWWKRNQLKYPYLARLARLYLAVPAMSAPSERIWSRASRILTLKKEPISNQKLHRELCLSRRTWLSYINIMSLLQRATKLKMKNI
jgi:hypothetical protein